VRDDERVVQTLIPVAIALLKSPFSLLPVRKHITEDEPISSEKLEKIRIYLNNRKNFVC
jgi:hypothetical protein